MQMVYRRDKIIPQFPVGTQPFIADAGLFYFVTSTIQSMMLYCM
jgi:hypothetical protein